MDGQALCLGRMRLGGVDCRSDVQASLVLPALPVVLPTQRVPDEGVPPPVTLPETPTA